MSVSKTKLFLGITVALVLAFLIDPHLLGVQTANAQMTIVPGNGVTSAGSLGEVLKDVVIKIAAVNTFLHILLLIALQFVSYLFQADFFNDEQMMKSLFVIWQLSRNIMNVFFALMLIGVAIYTIVTAKTDMIKDKMINFVIAVVLVNMSWFFPRVVLDVASVLSATVYSIPNLLPIPSCQSLDENGNAVPCKVVTAVLLFPTTLTEQENFCNTNAGGAAPSSPSCPCIPKIECHVLTDYNVALSPGGGMAPAHAMINGLAVSFARITTLAKIPAGISGVGPIGNAQAIQISTQVALGIFMALLVQLAVVLPLIGLAIGLLIRIIVIWVTTAFMPFVFLGYVINGKIGTNVFDFETDIWKEFVNAAFLPVVVGIPMTIGFIMLNTVVTINPPNNLPFVMNVPILNGVKTWWALIWMFAAIGIIWKGSFDALSKSKFTSGITEKIRGFGEMIGGAAIRLPLLTPVPLPGMPKATLATFANAPRLLSDTIRFQTSGNATDSFSDNLRRRFGGQAGQGGQAAGNAAKTAEQIATEIDQGKQNTEKIVQALERLKNASASGNEAERKQAVISIQQEVGGGNGVEALQRVQQIVGLTKNNNQELKRVMSDIGDFNAQIDKERQSANP